MLIFSEPLAMQMPSPGADWPAIVMKGCSISRSRSSRMVPATRKTMVRGPAAAIAARSVPGPLSARLVTAITWPPRPPGVNMPPPHAPGNAGKARGNSGGNGGT